MRDTLRGLDRLDVRFQGRTLSWSLVTGGARIARAAILIAMLLSVVVLTVLPDVRSGAVTTPIVVVGVLLGRWRRSRGFFDSPIADAALRALPGVGRQILPGHWRVEGPEARVLAARFDQWQAYGVPEAALTPEPDQVAHESYQPGQPWPTPPSGPAEPWPLLDRPGPG